MLRVLFAKMNGASASSAKGAMQQQMAQLTRRQQEPMPEPVFLSEGATLPLSTGAAEYNENFEVVQQQMDGGGRSSFRGASRTHTASSGGGADGGGAGGGEVDYGRDNYGFDAIGGGSLHSSQFGTAVDSKERQRGESADQQGEDVSMLASIASTNST